MSDDRVARHPLVVALAVVVFAEAALVAAAAGTLLVELFVDVAGSVASAVALTVLTAAAAAWLVTMGIGVLRGRAWVRGAIVVWQILQIAIAVGAFQGVFARPDIGWLLLVPAIVALGLLFTRPVTAHLVRRDQR